MASKIFIDGHAGTTGLRIRDWLSRRGDVTLLEIDEAKRKDPDARRAHLQAADVAVLCLPDGAAREAAEFARGTGTRLLDASTAHRVADGWVYGLAEFVPGQRQAIADAERVSNPGCYATAVILLVRPLVDAGLLSADAPLTVNALSGYSGGGRTKIERWEDPDDGLLGLPFDAPYSLDRTHKHIPEMKHYAGLVHDPLFVPAVGPFRCGMRVAVPLSTALLDGAGPETGKRVWEALDARYRGETFVRVVPIREPMDADECALDPRACNDTNRIDLHVIPHQAGHVLLVATLDNLGKGAAGAAIQNLNLMLGNAEDEGLSVSS